MIESSEKAYEEKAIGIDLITPERILELSKIIQNNDGEQRDMAICEMVNGNMRLVLKLTKKYKRMPDYEDTLFDANLGLVKAVFSYDPEKGKFSTWASQKIFTEIRDGLLSRLNSPLSVSRYGTDIAFRIKNIQADVSGDVDLPDVHVVKMAMVGIMDGIPMENEHGEKHEIEDQTVRSPSEEVQITDLIEMVKETTTELNLSDDDINLVSDSGSGNGSCVPILAKKLDMKPSTLRMRRAKLLWQIRKRIFDKVGKEEYLLLSAFDKLPGRDWR